MGFIRILSLIENDRNGMMIKGSHVDENKSISPSLPRRVVLPPKINESIRVTAFI
jgi:hypothetical protein